MSKHKKIKEQQLKQQQIKQKIKVIGISKTGRKIIIAGIILLIFGFFILTKTDPEGQNWASVISPFLIVGAYIIIGIGIIFPEKKQEQIQ